jgi:eukaryotic-like serine/threonine-protein kinase
MTPEQWERISEIFDRALTLEGHEREVYLREVCADDPKFCDEVDSLLDSHRQAGSQFLQASEGVFDEVAEKDQPAEVQAGRRIGAYLVEEEIGHGGMGEVFAAKRVDGQYEKKVALKLVRSGYETSFILERFRNERQILASLDHPNIARLLEGGTSADGAPYLVMELVDGVPIDSYCEARELSVTERLLLFRQVCSAVQYAHQQLVIHRDIKPSNILVTKEGVPKLLDFGIAKILDPSGSTEVTSLRPMTPEYASPEQVRGEAISTYTDVYSLGVVLYRLLTGRSPYRVDTRTPARLAEAIKQDEPERPSTAIHRKKTSGADGDSREITPKAVSSTIEATPARLEKRLRGDLDFILLKALRKEAAQRYSSVEQMSEDIRRHLEGIPIAARKGTWNYRSGKFIRRHKVSVFAALLVVATLVTAIVVTRREALIAEARFNDVRKLANSLMFEVHDSIQQVPGTTAARKLIIERAQEYLDVLAKDSRSDSSLQRELAASYSKLASVQGHPQGANLGDSAGAAKNYRMAVELLTDCLARDSRNLDIAIQLSRAYQDLALALDSTGDQTGAKNSTRKALDILEPLAKSQPEDPRLRFGIATALEQAGTLLFSGNDLARVGEYYRRALAILVPLGEANPQRKDVQMEISFVHKHMGSLLGIQHQFPAALEHYRAALAIDEAQLRAEPSNTQVRYNITFTYSDTGWILSQQREFDAALEYYSKAWQIRSELAAADPNEVRAREGISNTDDYIGWIYTQKLDFGRALHWYQDALSIRQSLVQKDPANDRLKLKLAASQGRIAETYVNMASQVQSRSREHLRYCREAQNWVLKALPVYQQQEAQGKLTGTNVGKAAALQKIYDGCDRTTGPPS